MHAVLVADLKTTASCALFAGPPVTLQPLVDTARQLSRFQRLPAGQLLRLTRLFVCNLSYEALFSHPNIRKKKSDMYISLKPFMELVIYHHFPRVSFHAQTAFFLDDQLSTHHSCGSDLVYFYHCSSSST